MRHVCDHNFGISDPFVDVVHVSTGQAFFPALIVYESLDRTIVHLPDDEFHLSIYNYYTNPISRWGKHVVKAAPKLPCWKGYTP